MAVGARWPSGGAVAEWGRGGRVGARWPSGGVVAVWVRTLAWTGDRTVPGRARIPLWELRFETLAIPFTSLCQYRARFCEYTVANAPKIYPGRI